MQVKFRTRQLQRCYESHAAATRRWGATVARRYVQRINDVYAAETIEDLYRIPPLRFHPLKGDRQGQYALSLTDRVRLIVSVAGEARLIVGGEGVRKHYGD